MKLTVENFAKIKYAEFELDGITVVAGNNDTGKSTIGKILYSIFRALHNMDRKVLEERISEMVKSIEAILVDNDPRKSISLRYGLHRRLQRKLDEVFMDDVNCPISDVFNSIYEYLQSEYAIHNADDPSKKGELAAKLAAIQQIPYERIEKKIVELSFQDVFSNQINSLRSDNTQAMMKLQIKNRDIGIEFKQNQCSFFSKEIVLINQAVYIDNPFVMDYVRGRRNGLLFSNSLSTIIGKDLLELLNSEKDSSPVASLLLEDKLTEIAHIMDTVIPGEFTGDNSGLLLRREDYSEGINVRNLSTGLKSFAIIKRLLENNSLKERDVLILDEPEIHLHPQWQLIYAELVVLLQKSFQLTILLTTHSPFFLDAIEVFAAKHEISHMLHYYSSEMNNGMVTFADVTNRIDEIYQKMSEPIQFLENMRNKLRMEM